MIILLIEAYYRVHLSVSKQKKYSSGQALFSLHYLALKAVGAVVSFDLDFSGSNGLGGNNGKNGNGRVNADTVAAVEMATSR